MFENPKALEDISQGRKHPLPVIVDNPRGNDEQCEHNAQYIQHIVPFSYMEPQGTSNCQTVPFMHVTVVKVCKSNAKYYHQSMIYMIQILLNA